MKIKCPKCGHEQDLELTSSDYAEVLSHVKDEEIAKKVAEQKAYIESQYAAKAKVDAADADKKLTTAISAKDAEIAELKAKLGSAETDKKAAVTNAESVKDQEIAKLKAQLLTADSDKKIAVSEAVEGLKQTLVDEKNKYTELKGKMETELAKKDNDILHLNESHKNEISRKDEEIAYYREHKAKLSVKMLGESLEQHCMTLFEMNHATMFPNAYFAKDNDVVDNTKADFIYRDYENGTEYISICFEMKNEADESKTKHKNDDFLEKLDKDRTKKKCEYAVLVSMLEPESELYNTGIVDVSYKYPKMYVIRPQFFLQIIGILRNAAKNTIAALVEVNEAKQMNFDIVEFGERLSKDQEEVAKNVENARSNFEETLKNIDKAIADLEKTREKLLLVDKNLRIANDKVQRISTKKLAKGLPSLEAKLDAIDNEEN